MGYFSNGSQAEIYQEEFCFKCVHWSNKNGCPCWDIHFLFNYEECNNKDSILHKMIPRDKTGLNKQCSFFKEEIQRLTGKIVKIN